MPKEISIAEVLYKINMNDGTPFMLKFMRSQGKNVGTYKSIRALPGRDTGEKSESSTKQLHRLKDNRQLMLNDLDAGHIITLFITHIKHYNGFRVKH